MRSEGQNWWRDRFVTVMIVPERTRRVHKVVVPFFLVKLSAVLFSLLAVFLIIMGIDYVHVLGRLAENKRLKGENYKLRQDMQLIRNKVDLMETTVERVRNYAKKLQVLTGQAGQGSKSLPDIPWGNGAVEGGDGEEAEQRAPATKRPRGRRHSQHAAPRPSEPEVDLVALTAGMPLIDRVQRLNTVTQVTETKLTELQIYLLAQSAVIAATPSMMPITGYFSSTFGYRRHPISGAYVLHAGVDIAADSGTPVRAPADGVVLFSGYKEGYGKALVVDHGYGIRTIFGHASKLFVTQGQKLKRGEKIAEVGSTGRSTGPHLHFEIRKNGIPMNPVTFISRAHF